MAYQSPTIFPPVAPRTRWILVGVALLYILLFIDTVRRMVASITSMLNAGRSF